MASRTPLERPVAIDHSEARAARGRAMLEPVLAGLARAPLVERQSIEQMMASSREHPDPVSWAKITVADFGGTGVSDCAVGNTARGTSGSNPPSHDFLHHRIVHPRPPRRGPVASCVGIC